ncbi:hypothetical protein QYF36_004374 [Acer negundo]|nr:hypothetical protein QYF36_004374 [Acer negundo]
MGEKAKEGMRRMGFRQPAKVHGLVRRERVLVVVGLVRTLHEENRVEVLVDMDLKGCFDAHQIWKKR